MTIIRKEAKKRVTKTLYYSHVSNEAGEDMGGGILNSSEHIETEMWLDSKNHPIFNPDKEEWVLSNEIQLHIGGTRRAMEELGTILIALARYDTPYPKYNLQFDLSDIQGKPPMHLVLHVPVGDISNKVGFETVHSVAKVRFDKNGMLLNDSDVKNK